MRKLGISILSSAFFAVVLSFGTAQASTSCSEELSGSVTAGIYSSYAISLGAEIDDRTTTQEAVLLNIPCSDFSLELWRSDGWHEGGHDETDFSLLYNDGFFFGKAAFYEIDGPDDIFEFQLGVQHDIVMLGEEIQPYSDVTVHSSLTGQEDAHLKFGVRYSRPVLKDVAVLRLDLSTRAVNLIGSSDGYSVQAANAALDFTLAENTTLTVGSKNFWSPRLDDGYRPVFFGAVTVSF
ncbi:hypothetical protein JXR01_00745 [Candidatus Kaiserbacteria bacterium]|nr:MAG: hypothetical protein JXR01_00745 [Candidatus Kaiserbacteria bacterium]